MTKEQFERATKINKQLLVLKNRIEAIEVAMDEDSFREYGLDVLSVPHKKGDRMRTTINNCMHDIDHTLVLTCQEQLHGCAFNIFCLFKKEIAKLETELNDL